MDKYLSYVLYFSFPMICWLCPAAADMPFTPAAPVLPAAIEHSDPIANELQTLDRLINATQTSLEKQRELKSAIADYQKLQELYLKNDQDRELLFRMVKSAHKILNEIKENHLLHVFSPDFISELTLFSQVASKKGIPKP